MIAPLLAALLVQSPTPPRLAFARPFAVAPGATVKLVLRGQNLQHLTAVQVHEPKSRAKLLGPAKKAAPPGKLTADKVGDAEVEVELTVAADAPLGRIGIAVVGVGGVSNPALISVAGEPRVAEQTEPHNGFTIAQPVTLPVAVEGAIDRGRQADVYRFTGAKGDRVRVRVDASRFGSPLDPVVTVCDADRNVLTVADDTPDSFDPDVTLTLPRDGTFYVTVQDAHDTDSPLHAYRLVVTK